MLAIRVSAAALAVAACFPLFAQAGNETVFVGTSTSGSSDAFLFADSGTGLIRNQGGNLFTDNVTDAVWADTGRNLYVGQSLQGRVARASWNGSTPTWSTFYNPAAACYGLGFDAARQLLYVLVGTNSAARELHCVDGNPTSPTYGQNLATTTQLTGVTRERWELGLSGNLAAVPHGFLQAGLFELVDTNPTSPTFLQTVLSLPVPGLTGGGLTLASDVDVSIDDQYAYVLYHVLGAGGLAVLHIPTQTWLDLDPAPGQQNLSLPLTVPNRMALSNDRTFSVISGQGSGGWVARVDYDYANPSATTLTQLAIGSALPNCNAASLSPDNTRCAVSSTPTFLATPSYLVILDVQTGSVLQNVTFSTGWNVYTTAWQDASPTATYTSYLAGCNGSLGVPTLAAAPGSRPALGSTFQAIAGNLPFGIAVLQLGLADTFVPLDGIGMPGCVLGVNPLASFVLSAPGSSATWSWALPGTASLFGVQFFTQAFPLDLAANNFGFTASNAAVGELGF
jgi:hypothetical protein